MKVFHRLILLLAATGFLCLPVSAQYLSVPRNPYGERPVIIPAPTSVAGIPTPVINLDEGWFRKESPSEDFISSETQPEGFEPFTLVHSTWATRTPDAIVGFWRKVSIPTAFVGQRVILRFDGTAHAAKLWVNGQYVRDHWGSYNSWTADITDYVKPGEDAVVGLQLDERSIGVAAYVRFSADIHGHVSLYAVPSKRRITR